MKKSFFITLLILVVTNVFWIYIVIDNGITHTYQQVTFEKKLETIKILSDFLVKEGEKYTKKDILYMLRQRNKESFIVEKENSINIENIKFIFKNNILIEIEG